MKINAFVILICALSYVSCQKGRELMDESPSEPLTRSIYSTSGDNTSRISKEEALKIAEPVTGKYPDRWVDISNEIIPAGTRIAFNMMGHQLDIDDRSYCQSPNYDSWLLVIDNDVSVSGREQLIHIFVDVESGVYSTMELEGRAIVEWDTSRNNRIPSGNDNGIKGAKKQRLPERSGGITRWAVIISGGCDSLNNKSRYYYDCVNIYSKLTQVLGYPKGNIFCLMADGTDPALDQRIGPNTYISSDPDLDGDGTNDIQYAANKNNVATVFSNLSLLVNPGDEVLVFMTDHGTPSGNFCLWESETLSPSELNIELDKLGSSVMIDIVMGQCFSGAFVSPLSATNRTIAASCLSTESAWAIEYEYNLFLHYWTEYISSANTGGDGYVSPRELFTSAVVAILHLSSQHPQYSSTPTVFGETHSIAGELIPYISGSDYLSTDINSLYSIVNYPNSTSVTWSVGHNVSLLSYTDSTAVVKGSITFPERFCEETTSVNATIVVDGKTHSLGKAIASVWKPGMCFDGNNIWGSNGSYQVRHLGGEYGYEWAVDNSAWQITGYNDYSVNVIENYTSGPVYLYVGFYDPLGEMILVRDRVH